MLKYKMPLNHYLFTFRSQITEQELFENFLSIFIPHLKQCQDYSYSVEEDGTLQKHIHAIWSSKAKDMHACKQLFDKKIFKEFKKSLFAKQTTEPAGFDNQKIKEDDFLKVLGYVNKETQCTRRGYSFTNEKILESVDYYYTSQHIDKSIKKSDLTIVTAKNIHILVKDYCEKNNLEPSQPITKLKMQKDGYCFSQCPKVFETMEELEIIMYPDRFDEKLPESYKQLKHKHQLRVEQNIFLQDTINRLNKEIKELGGIQLGMPPLNP